MLRKHNDFLLSCCIRYLEALNLLSVHPQLRVRFTSSYLRMDNNCMLSEFSNMARMGLQDFWAKKVAKDATSFQMNSDYKGRKEILQSLGRGSSREVPCLVLPPHPLCESSSLQWTTTATECHTLNNCKQYAAADEAQGLVAAVSIDAAVVCYPRKAAASTMNSSAPAPIEKRVIPRSLENASENEGRLNRFHLDSGARGKGGNMIAPENSETQPVIAHKNETTETIEAPTVQALLDSNAGSTVNKESQTIEMNANDDGDSPRECKREKIPNPTQLRKQSSNYHSSNKSLDRTELQRSERSEMQQPYKAPASHCRITRQRGTLELATSRLVCQSLQAVIVTKERTVKSRHSKKPVTS